MLRDHLLTPCDPVQETPPTNADFSWFTHSSYSKNENDNYHGGYVTATTFEVTEAVPLSLGILAQQAELSAPIPALC